MGAFNGEVSCDRDYKSLVKDVLLLKRERSASKVPNRLSEPAHLTLSTIPPHSIFISL